MIDFMDHSDISNTVLRKASSSTPSNFLSTYQS